jgi:hypothetical protein
MYEFLCEIVVYLFIGIGYLKHMSRLPFAGFTYPRK